MENGDARGGTTPMGAGSITAVVNRFPTPSETFIQRKLRGLRDAGWDVTVAAASLDDVATRHEALECVRLAPWRMTQRGAGERDPRRWPPIARSARDGSGSLRQRLVDAPLRSVESDVVHFEFSGIAVTYRSLLDDLSQHSRIVVSCRGAAEQIEPLHDPARAAALAEVFERVDLVHCVSDDMRRTVEQFGADPARILVNRPAVPVTDFSVLRDRPSRDGAPLQVLSIGRLHWKKGLDDGLRAIAALRGRGVEVRYRIAGEGAERQKLTFMIDQLDLGAHAELAGARTQEQVRDLLRCADVLLLPSLSEGISNAVLEAMAAGLPVVVTACGGMREVVDDGVEGHVVQIGAVTEMADRLELLAASQPARVAMGDAAARRADRDFDISRQVRLFDEAYRSLLR